MRIALAAFAASSLFSLPAVAAAPAPKAQPAPATASTTTAAADAGPSEGSEGALDTRWAIGAMLGLSTDYLNFGLGVRGGKTFGSHIYLGGSLLVHFAGDTYSGYSGPLTNYTSSSLVLYGGPEGGVDFDLKAVVLRAYVGLGPAYISWTVNTPGASASGANTRFVVWPGATVIYGFRGSPFFVGGDVRFVSLPGGPAVGFYAFGGIHFGS